MKNTNKNIMRAATAMVLMAATLTINFTNIAFAASPGALDFGFGSTGTVTTRVGAGNATADRCNDVAIKANGNVIVVGRADVGGTAGQNFSVLQYRPDGSLDTTFDTDGKVTTDFGGSDQANAVAIQPDGKIVVVGQVATFAPAANDFAIARYNPNGSLDTTFDTDGKATIDLAASTDAALDVAIQLDGKIVLAGLASNSLFGAVRLNTNGSLDTTFDTDGKAVIDPGGNGSSGANSMALQIDGKIVLGGKANISAQNDFMVIRLNTDGSLDTTFDGDGRQNTDIFNGDEITGIAIQNDGKIIGGGLSEGQNSTLVRYNPNGSLDTSFNGNGKVVFDAGGSDRIQDIVLQGDGKILAAFRGGTGTLGVLRFNINGSIDPTFGIGGISTVPVQTGLAEGVAINSSGKVVVVGETTTDIAIASFNITIEATASADFDGDGGADTTVYRPSSATWFTLRSSDQTVTIEQFGLTGDIPIDGDFDGDGRVDLAIFRPSSGVWFFKRSSNGTALGAQFGQSGDKPVVGDYDKDGKTDIAIFRPSTGENFILRSSSNFTTFFGYPFGQNGDINIMGGAQ